MRRNIYKHEIELKDLKIKNAPREEFRKLLEGIKYRGYEVEQLTDGRKVVVTKPGGKSTYGRIRREDFMVWIHDQNDSTLWLISHNQISRDLKEKGEVNPRETIKIIDALERVYNGEDPDDVINSINLNNPVGEPPELLLKVYKWIWGQEDCNYPNYPKDKGRTMSWEGWEKDNKTKKWVKTGTGIVDLREKLRKSVK